MSLDKNIPLVALLSILDKKFGRDTWKNLEPETVMLELGHPDYLIQEKIYVLHSVVDELNQALSKPEFLLWYTSVANNQYADFETISLPTSLELAWAIEQAKLICLATNQVFTPSPELIKTIAFLLREDGYSEPVKPFEFVPASELTAGQTPEDVALKKRAVRSYLSYMDKQSTSVQG